ncbi:TetR/AcrR family transcriptional regulator [Nocardia arizonensis]|uniref:TetR/AcrR family transcriptional regulator n=1 Tax=Nocardia arizonensis TaxID=1141647 RepID=UPI0006D07CA6|nr:TetR/AcrR family transcriptional regulator [Nocardia arizonensis]
MATIKYTTADYFDRAMEVLEESGFPALTAAGLCSTMGVTRGSFYHHFESFDDFVEKFLEHWETRYTTELIARSISTDFAEQIRLQSAFAIGLPHNAEAALRAWASVDPRVADVQRRVDAVRHEGLAASLRDHGTSPDKADLYATIALTTLVGMQVTTRPFEPAKLEKVYEELATALITSSRL